MAIENPMTPLPDAERLAEINEWHLEEGDMLDYRMGIKLLLVFREVLADYNRLHAKEHAQSGAGEGHVTAEPIETDDRDDDAHLAATLAAYEALAAAYPRQFRELYTTACDTHWTAKETPDA